LFAEQNQLIPHAAWGPCYRDHGCQIAAIVFFREVLQKVRLRTKNTAILKCFVKRETSQHITEWKDGNAASNAEQLRVTVCQGRYEQGAIHVAQRIVALKLDHNIRTNNTSSAPTSSLRHSDLTQLYPSSDNIIMI
ncbi:hypothetical protein T08_6346, partial [Trichinella sp. T8]